MSSAPFNFDNSYAKLPEGFFARVAPTPVAQPRLLALNESLALSLGLDLDELRKRAVIEFLAGNTTPPEAEPIAMAYAGHQFGNFVPQLGDGRAILLGEVRDPEGKRWDVQLKGSGQTPFSRRGDGRSPLGPVVREYLLSEGMHALGIPTTRSLAVVATGEEVYRQKVEPGGILTRVAASHLRVGTFEYFAARGSKELLQRVADYTIERHCPHAKEDAEPYRALLRHVIARQASLLSLWMQVGFIHGVMNTDNMALSGETIDYGPCAFMDEYDPRTVFSSIDRGGRYAFNNQPVIGLWNLSRFAETLLPLLANSGEKGVTIAEEELGRFRTLFSEKWLAGMCMKLGVTKVVDNDAELVEDFLTILFEQQADFTNSFRGLSDLLEEKASELDGCAKLHRAESFAAWTEKWKERLRQEGREPEAVADEMRRVNPLYIPRNHLVAAAIEGVVEKGDVEPFEKLLSFLREPFSLREGGEEFARLPKEQERVVATFCGT